MKFIVALACLLALAYASDDVQVIRNDAEVNVEDFKYGYEFSNSIKAQQEGKLVGADTWKVDGEYSYSSPEGEAVSMQYVADENGYQVIAANPPLPTPPPIPAAILKSLEYIAAHPSKEYVN